MVLSYLLAQIIPVIENRKGFLIMLGTGNADEWILGYCSKYDNSSSDINAIGWLGKVALRKLAQFILEKYKI